MTERTLYLFGKLGVDLLKGCFLGTAANKLGSFAGEHITDNKEAKVWTGFAGSVVSQAALVGVLENRRWCRTGVVRITAKIISLFSAAFPQQKTEYTPFQPMSLYTQNQFQADKWWQKLCALGAGGTVAFHGMQRFGPVWGLVMGNIVAGVPVRI